MLMTMEEEYKRESELFPSPERLEKVTNIWMKNVFILSQVIISETCKNLCMKLFCCILYTIIIYIHL